jgi:hypothetical protein
MAKSESNHATTFIVFFAVIALAINSVRFREIYREREAQRSSQLAEQNQEQAQNAIQEAAAKHAQYVAQYVNPGFSKRPGTQSLALLVVNQNGKLDTQVASVIAAHFKSENVSVSSSFFTAKFISDNLFNKVFDGSTDILNQLGLTNSLDGVLLARETVQFVKNSASMDNLITANMTIEVQLVPVSGSVQNKTWKFIAAGAGFSQTEAESNAEDRLDKKISADTTISLSQ